MARQVKVAPSNTHVVFPMLEPSMLKIEEQMQGENLPSRDFGLKATFEK